MRSRKISILAFTATFFILATDALPFLPLIARELSKREATPDQQTADSVNGFSDAKKQADDPRADGGLVPGLPAMPGLGGGGGEGASGGGMMINQPLAMMGGFTMLVMPAQDAMAMAQSFQQFASSMPQMPNLMGR